MAYHIICDIIKVSNKSQSEKKFRMFHVEHFEREEILIWEE